MYVRTRPSDNVKVLVTLAECEVIEEQWSIVRGTHAAYVAERERQRHVAARLEKSTGRKPSPEALVFAIAVDDARQAADDGHWGLYRNALLSQAEALRRRGDTHAAFDRILAVNYLDLAGAENNGTRVPSSGFNRGFRRESAFLAPGVLGMTSEWAEDLHLDVVQIGAEFIRVAAEYQASLKIRLSPVAAWKQLELELSA